LSLLDSHISYKTEKLEAVIWFLGFNNYIFLSLSFGSDGAKLGL